MHKHEDKCERREGSRLQVRVILPDPSIEVPPLSFPAYFLNHGFAGCLRAIGPMWTLPLPVRLLFGAPMLELTDHVAVR